jgi:hypothetical protein
MPNAALSYERLSDGSNGVQTIKESRKGIRQTSLKNRDSPEGKSSQQKQIPRDSLVNNPPTNEGLTKSRRKKFRTTQFEGQTGGNPTGEKIDESRNGKFNQRNRSEGRTPQSTSEARQTERRRVADKQQSTDKRADCH